MAENLNQEKGMGDSEIAKHLITALGMISELKNPKFEPEYGELINKLTMLNDSPDSGPASMSARLQVHVAAEDLLDKVKSTGDTDFYNHLKKDILDPFPQL